MPQSVSSSGGRLIHVLLGALLAATCLRVWSGSIGCATEAYAQIPDAGAQRGELLREARRTNALLEEIVETLRTRTLKVEILGTDKPGAPDSRPPGARVP